MISSGARAQMVSGESEFTLEEITVTAEKREADVQKVPASVDVLSGDDLLESGKLGTGNILANIPNVKGGGDNVVIRGVEMKTENAEGRPPTATATYVDGVFSGIGSSYDLERVEVLRGPQGTLYGRSALGGVASYVTRNPMLDEFSATINAEVGKAALRNLTAVVNAPVADVFAVRVSGNYREREGYLNGKGGYSETKDGRIKMLYKPSENLDIVGTAQISQSKANSGGRSVILVKPDGPFDYTSARLIETQEGAPRTSAQYSLNADYDFGSSKLTYIGGYQTYDDTKGGGMEQTMFNVIMEQIGSTPEDTKFTQEVRLASSSEGPLQWLIGGSYYRNKFEQLMTSIQKRVFTDTTMTVENTDPSVQDVFIFSNASSGTVNNYGVFTEETYELADDVRVTAGLRYDNTKIEGTSAWVFNTAEAGRGIAMAPEVYVSSSYTGSYTYNNITYKLRFEYDVTPENMLYVLTSTGFLPGDVRISPYFTGPGQVAFVPLPYDEEKMTSYEAGIKNRFLDNRLQVNGDIFYYNYSGFRTAVNTAPAGQQRPVYAMAIIGLKMYGAEFDTKWMLTMKDKLSFNAGYMVKKITDVPELMESKLMLTKYPGYPPLTANLGYDHTFTIPNGSILAARAELNYTSGYYLGQLTETQIAGVEGNRYTTKEWDWTSSYILGNINATWTSPQNKYSATAYVRNVFDKEYKAGVSIPTDGDTTVYGSVTVNPGAPRVWGFLLSAKF